MERRSLLQAALGALTFGLLGRVASAAEPAAQPAPLPGPVCPDLRQVMAQNAVLAMAEVPATEDREVARQILLKYWQAPNGTIPVVRGENNLYSAPTVWRMNEQDLKATAFGQAQGWCTVCSPRYTFDIWPDGKEWLHRVAQVICNDLAKHLGPGSRYTLPVAHIYVEAGQASMWGELEVAL